jgi:predicted nucleotidyltransferase component of viral defense system
MMITRAEMLSVAEFHQLPVTTIQKDYVLGWLLRSIAVHPVLSQWVFKGGTCLKKCFFETNRFSEDLDFTIPITQVLNTSFLETHLDTLVKWIEERCGLVFPRHDWKIEEYLNPKGKPAYLVKISYSGPHPQPVRSLQRVKFDLTQDELVVDNPDLRQLYHGYPDAQKPPPRIRCYSINEILAEKTRALMQRKGRARDVYDLVNISRNFRDQIDPDRARKIAKEKFRFKDLPIPTVDGVMGFVDNGQLRAAWKEQLAHQIHQLPGVDSFLADLRDAIAWWLEPAQAVQKLAPMPAAVGRLADRTMYADSPWRNSPSPMDRIRYAARSRLAAIVEYNGSKRLVEPYSLRYPATGNELLHVWEIEKDGQPVGAPRSYKTEEIISASVSGKEFRPRYAVEL